MAEELRRGRGRIGVRPRCDLFHKAPFSARPLQPHVLLYDRVKDDILGAVGSSSETTPLVQAESAFSSLFRLPSWVPRGPLSIGDPESKDWVVLRLVQESVPWVRSCMSEISRIR